MQQRTATLLQHIMWHQTQSSSAKVYKVLEGPAYTLYIIQIQRKQGWVTCSPFEQSNSRKFDRRRNGRLPRAVVTLPPGSTEQQLKTRALSTISSCSPNLANKAQALLGELCYNCISPALAANGDSSF